MGQIPAILTAFSMQKLHRFHAPGASLNWEIVRLGDWLSRCKSNCMNAPKKNLLESNRNPVVLGRMSWIADELIGIRTLEQRLSKKLQSTSTSNKRILLDGIRTLNTRVELLDRALDEYSRAGLAA